MKKEIFIGGKGLATQDATWMLLEKNKYKIIVIADHGNCESMINADGSPNTAHTTNPVRVLPILSQLHSQKIQRRSEWSDPNHLHGYHDKRLLFQDKVIFW